MLKTYISFLRNDCSEVESYRYDGNECFTLYNGINAVYGGWICESGGEPINLNSLEQSTYAEAAINSFNALITDPSTPWLECTGEDIEYVGEWLALWGIT